MVAEEGATEASKRIQDNYNELQELALVAAIGYRNNSVSAAQRIMVILLPKAVQDKARRPTLMSDMADLMDGFFDEEME